MLIQEIARGWPDIDEGCGCVHIVRKLRVRHLSGVIAIYAHLVEQNTIDVRANKVIVIGQSGVRPLCGELAEIVRTRLLGFPILGWVRDGAWAHAVRRLSLALEWVDFCLHHIDDRYLHILSRCFRFEL